MLKIDNNYIKFNGMGLFETEAEWKHPTITEKTYEIIYVISGMVFIEEQGEFFELKKGDMLILKPGIEHKGYLESSGKTSFYWAHFFTDNINQFTKGRFLLSGIKQDFLFKEMLHHSHKDKASQVMTELLLAQILIGNAQDYAEEKSRKLTKDIFEWTRINSAPHLKATAVAQHFDYSVDHLTRLIKKEYGKNLKQLISEFILEKAKGLLVNTNFSIKEISAALEFEDPNIFLKFFKYHSGISPSQYRNSYHITHMNKK